MKLASSISMLFNNQFDIDRALENVSESLEEKESEYDAVKDSGIYF